MPNHREPEGRTGSRRASWGLKVGIRNPRLRAWGPTAEPGPRVGEVLRVSRETRRPVPEPCSRGPSVGPENAGSEPGRQEKLRMPGHKERARAEPGFGPELKTEGAYPEPRLKTSTWRSRHDAVSGSPWMRVRTRRSPTQTQHPRNPPAAPTRLVEWRRRSSQPISSRSWLLQRPVVRHPAAARRPLVAALRHSGQQSARLSRETPRLHSAGAAVPARVVADRARCRAASAPGRSHEPRQSFDWFATACTLWDFGVASPPVSRETGGSAISPLCAGY